jgi:hypothetical protein
MLLQEDDEGGAVKTRLRAGEMECVAGKIPGLEPFLFLSAPSKCSYCAEEFLLRHSFEGDHFPSVTSAGMPAFKRISVLGMVMVTANTSLLRSSLDCTLLGVYSALLPILVTAPWNVSLG